MRLVCDAFDLAMGSALETKVDSIWRPLAFFSKKFTPAQVKYATYDRELMAIEQSIKHFHYALEGRSFEVCTDHKPIIYSQKHTHEKAPAHRVRRIAYLSQFNITYSHIKGEDNPVADALSRIKPVVSSLTANIEALSFPKIFDTKTLSLQQASDPELKNILSSPNHPLKLHKCTWDPGNLTIYCNIQDVNLRPYISLPLREKIISLYHSNPHSSARVTDA